MIGMVDPQLDDKRFDVEAVSNGFIISATAMVTHPGPSPMESAAKANLAMLNVAEVQLKPEFEDGDVDPRQFKLRQALAEARGHMAGMLQPEQNFSMRRVRVLCMTLPELHKVIDRYLSMGVLCASSDAPAGP